MNESAERPDPVPKRPPAILRLVTLFMNRLNGSQRALGGCTVESVFILRSNGCNFSRGIQARPKRCGQIL